MKIRTRILAGYLLVAIPFAVFAVGGYLFVRDIGTAFTTMATQTITDNELLDDLRFSGMWVVSSAVEIVWLENRTPRNARRIDEEKNFLRKGELLLRRNLETMRVGGSVHDRSAVLPVSEKLLAAALELAAAARPGTPAGTVDAKKDVLEAAEKDFLKAIEHSVGEQNRAFVVQRQAVDDSIARAFVAMAVLGLSGLAIACLGGIRIAGSLSLPILRLREAAEKMAGGDAGVHVERESADEVGDLAEAFRAMAVARRRAETQLERQAMTLAEQNEDLKSFAWISSHDLREPLVTIRGFAGELKQSLQDVDGRLANALDHLDDRDRMAVITAFQYDVPEAFSFIEKSVEQMDALVYSIQKLSQLGHLELEPQALETRKLVERVVAGLAERVADTEATVQIEDLPVVTADRRLLSQVFGQLLEHALDSRVPGQRLAIAVCATRSDRDVTFHVRDNGRGIRAEALPRVFALAAPGDRHERKQDVELAFVKALVRRMGGRIWCESSPGSETVFSFTVPAPEE